MDVGQQLAGVPSSEAPVSSGADARGFDELMDTFSLHHFIIRHGVTLDTTPEFASYRTVDMSSTSPPGVTRSRRHDEGSRFGTSCPVYSS